MKKFAATAVCLLLSVCLLFGCGRRMDNETVDTTTHTTNTTAPTAEATVPSTSTVPEASTMPSVESDTPGGVEDQSRSSTHNHKPFPRTNIKKR